MRLSSRSCLRKTPRPGPRLCGEVEEEEGEEEEGEEEVSEEEGWGG